MIKFTFIRKLVDNRDVDTYATYLRKKRFAIFQSLLSSIPRPLRILDIGGTQLFWEQMGFNCEVDIQVVLLNPLPIKVSFSNYIGLIGDGREMPYFRDKEFDVVFSNSVIEHVGGYDDQHQMANEIKRVGKRYFLQTPNRFFPIEPHFLFPFFQFLPLSIRVFLLSHFNMGWFERIPDKLKAKEVANSVRLLSEKEIKVLFSNAYIHKENFLGLTKSFAVYSGWEQQKTFMRLPK